MKHHLSRRERKIKNLPNRLADRVFFNEVPYTSLAQAEYAESMANKDITAWQKGVWQYLCDHATPHKRGYVIRMVIPSESTFWKRVEARKLGRYSRNSTTAMQKKIDSLIYGSVFQSRVEQFLNQGSHPFWFRVVLLLRNKLNKIVGLRVKEKVERGWQDFPVYQEEVD